MMMDCLILGDSIAVGTSNYMKDCVSLSKGGINSWQWNKMYGDRATATDVSYNKVVISMGSNDHVGVNTQKELEKLRATIHGKKVYWIMPAGNLKASNVPIEKIQDIVMKIAMYNNDSIVYIKDLSSDKIHPTANGYKKIAAEAQ
jgi:lysophospholipase L1-like esterase